MWKFISSWLMPDWENNNISNSMYPVTRVAFVRFPVRNTNVSTSCYEHTAFSPILCCSIVISFECTMLCGTGSTWPLPVCLFKLASKLPNGYFIQYIFIWSYHDMSCLHIYSQNRMWHVKEILNTTFMSYNFFVWKTRLCIVFLKWIL